MDIAPKDIILTEELVRTVTAAFVNEGPISRNRREELGLDYFYPLNQVKIDWVLEYAKSVKTMQCDRGIMGAIKGTVFHYLNTWITNRHCVGISLDDVELIIPGTELITPDVHNLNGTKVYTFYSSADSFSDSRRDLLAFLHKTDVPSMHPEHFPNTPGAIVPAIMIGYPGLSLEPFVTIGRIEFRDGMYAIAKCNIYSIGGNSGSPVFDLDKRLIGVTSGDELELAYGIDRLIQLKVKGIMD